MELPPTEIILQWAWLGFLVACSLYGYWQLRIREDLGKFAESETDRLSRDKGIQRNNDGRLRAVHRPLQRLKEEESEYRSGNKSNSVINEYIEKLEARLTLIQSFNKELDIRILRGWALFTLVTLESTFLLLTSTEYFYSDHNSFREAINSACTVFAAYASEPLAIFTGAQPVDEATLEGGKASYWTQRYVAFVVPSQASGLWFGLSFVSKPKAFEESISALRRNIRIGRKDPAAFRRKILAGKFGDRTMAALVMMAYKLFRSRDLHKADAFSQQSRYGT